MGVHGHEVNNNGFSYATRLLRIALRFIQVTGPVDIVIRRPDKASRNPGLALGQT